MYFEQIVFNKLIDNKKIYITDCQGKNKYIHEQIFSTKQSTSVGFTKE